ncbi:MAG TPA: LiaF domain-containing protein [Gemmatimonadaceae bacterium]
MNYRSLALAALAGALPSIAGAQSWRTLDVSRQLRDTTELHVHVQYGAGRFDLRGANTPVLYSMELRYDENSATPLHRFDATAGTLDIGLKDAADGSHWIHHQSDDGNNAAMRLMLAPTVPMDLTLSLGATEARVDLGGLTLRGLHIESGAADETVDFSSPNRARLGAITVDVGAASFAATNLANANASTVNVHGGVGALTLGFGGTWTGDMDANVQVTLGKVTLRIPDDVGVQLDMQRFLTSFDNDGLVKRDGSYYSDNWDSARYHLRVHVQTTFGGIAIERISSAAQP